MRELLFFLPQTNPRIPVIFGEELERNVGIALYITVCYGLLTKQRLFAHTNTLRGHLQKSILQAQATPLSALRRFDSHMKEPEVTQQEWLCPSRPFLLFERGQRICRDN